MTVDLLRKVRADLKEDELVDFVKKKLNGHPITTGQEIALEYRGASLAFTVNQVSIPDAKTQLHTYAKSAVLVPEIDLRIDAAKNR